MPTTVALLRGINLGSRRRVAMADLRGWLDELGCARVRTFLQSGNVVFDSDEPLSSLGPLIEARLADGAGFPIACVLRTAGELRAVVESDPFGDVATDGTRYLVSFRAAPAPPPPFARADFEPERFHFGERESFFWLPDGMRNSRLLAAVAKADDGAATMRNWNTVTRLLALAETAPNGRG
ncbi:DUF1697 domain-containing protein [Nonomuraea roseoviolacea]|uniref:Uncharacterized protein (DUF1697 family) n=1 Tax=Nonomuraea roseoviolacea subsp. carminata TaxID=160689 RepID=A0ABT1K7Z9_9ACTN|nr:DUF1697 domain-containing protein [Nonomuraea roseoviolacea]MCP2349827.1 uncharacterized protein (DUF1697 family) [Nonomuraea roseoviolacea subsp. carminata]